MADKQIVFADQDQMLVESIVMDKDKAGAMKFLTQLLERLKGHPGFACGYRPFK